MHCPEEITDVVLAFATSIFSHGAPVYVECSPLPGKPSCECFPIVAEHIETHGGSRELGWSIYMWPGVYIEAELHAVWVDPSGVRHDIAPHRLPFKRILFLPDVTANYGETHQVDNRRKALVKNPDVLNFIRAAHGIYEEENRGKFATMDRFITTPRWHKLQKVKNDCEVRMMKKFGPPPGMPDLGELGQKLRGRFSS